MVKIDQADLEIAEWNNRLPILYMFAATHIAYFIFRNFLFHR